MRECNFISQEKLFDSIISNMKIGIFWKDANRRFKGANNFFYEYYDLKPKDILNKTDEDMGWHIDPEPFKKEELKVLSGHSIINDVGTCIAKGINRDIMATKMPIYDSDNHIVGFWGYFIDISDRIAEINELRLACTIDPLTKIKNRRGFDDSLTSYMNAWYNNKTDFALFFIDIDRFKHFNDVYGHDIGDEVLVKTSEAMLKEFTTTAVLVRMGGDEFVLIKQVSSKDEFDSIMQRIHKSYASVKIKGVNETLKVSIGGALYSETLDKESLLKLADTRMYDVKKSKRGTRV